MNAQADKPRDEWKETWDWATEIWGPTTEEDKREVIRFCGGGPQAERMTEKAADLTFSWFFRRIASHVAQERGWEEVGSSDVWHASYDCVKRAKAEGKVTTRNDLKNHVCDWHGAYFY